MTEAHANARLEALCDAVFAIAMTLLIIDVTVPAAASIASSSELCVHCSTWLHPSSRLS